MQIFVRSLFLNCAVSLCSFEEFRTVLHTLWCRGDGGGGAIRSSKRRRPEPVKGFGPSLFLLLIMSKAQMGLMMCKLSEGDCARKDNVLR